jgi:integrase
MAPRIWVWQRMAHSLPQPQPGTRHDLTVRPRRQPAKPTHSLPHPREGHTWPGGLSPWQPPSRRSLRPPRHSSPSGALPDSTRRSYDQTLTWLVRELGSDRPLSTFTVEAVTVAVTTAWSGRAPATWNRQVATVRSFLAFCRRRWLVDDLAADLERRPEPVDRTKAIPLPQLERALALRGRRRAGEGAVAGCSMRRPPGPGGALTAHSAGRAPAPPRGLRVPHRTGGHPGMGRCRRWAPTGAAARRAPIAQGMGCPVGSYRPRLAT